MNPNQKKAANGLERALKRCRDAGLGVYAFDANIFVCPQPEGREHPLWDHNSLAVCDDLGRVMYVYGLDSDGGAGV